MSRSVHVSPAPRAESALASITPAAQRGEIRSLTGLRIVAAVWVVVFHFERQLAESFGAPLDLVRPLISAGWLGVDLFFLLSGFVLTLNYVDRLGRRFRMRASVSFLWGRVARIWPLYAVLSTVMTCWILIAGWNTPWPVEDRPVVTAAGFLEQLALVQMWHRMFYPPSSYLPPGWSLSVEFLAYASFPLGVLLLWRVRNAPPALLAGLAVSAMMPLAVYGYVEGLSTHNLPWPLRIAGAFLSGGLTSLFVRRVRGSAGALRWAPTVAVVCIVELTVVAYWTGAQVQSGHVDRSVIAVVLFPLLVGALALSDRGPAAVLSREVFVLGGRISFALYLVHWLFLDIQFWLQAHVAILRPGSATLALVQAHLVLGALVSSYLLWRFVEEPGRKYLLRHGPGRAVRPTAAVIADARPASPGPHASRLPVRPIRPVRSTHPDTIEPPLPRPAVSRPRRPAVATEDPARPLRTAPVHHPSSQQQRTGAR